MVFHAAHLVRHAHDGASGIYTGTCIVKRGRAATTSIAPVNRTSAASSPGPKLLLRPVLTPARVWQRQVHHGNLTCPHNAQCLHDG